LGALGMAEDHLPRALGNDLEQLTKQGDVETLCLAWQWGGVPTTDSSRTNTCQTSSLSRRSSGGMIRSAMNRSGSQ